MFGKVLRWGLPALMTVVGGTGLALAVTGADMAADLEARATAAMGPDARWAALRFESRDVVLSGTASDPAQVAALASRLAALHGIRSVTSEVVIAELAAPFTLTASRGPDGIWLAGAVPDEPARLRLASRDGVDASALDVRAGAPVRDLWTAAVTHGLAYLDEFDAGSVQLRDLALEIAGRARSAEAYAALAALQQAGPPAGVTVRAEITPALVAPYEWRARYDGAALVLSGYVPDETLARRLRSGDFGVPVSTSLRLGSGAPADFTESLDLLLRNLLVLEAGTATISDSTLTLQGTPRSPEAAAQVRQAMASSDAIVTLDPPKVLHYRFSATRTADGIRLDGLVPDAATRARLEAGAEIDGSGLEVARGAPARFDSAVEFGLGLLGHLSEGRFSLRDTVLTFEGRAATLTDFAAIETALALGPPQGLVLARAEVLPPLAIPFLWSASKEDDGATRLGGHVPTRDIRDRLRAATTRLTGDEMSLADGEPEGFLASATAGLQLLELVDTGRVAFDGNGWSFRGAVTAHQQAEELRAAFAAAGLDDADWTLEVDAPPALPQLVEDYRFIATKGEDGQLQFEGQVPTAGLQSVLSLRAEAPDGNRTELARGAPETFVSRVLAGLDGLEALASGSISYADGLWTLAGVPPTVAAADAAIAALGEAAPDWRTSLTDPIEAPAPEPAVAAIDDAAVPADGEAAAGEAEAPESGIATQLAGDLVFAAAKTLGEPVVLTGAVPAEATRQFFGVIAGQVPTDDLEVVDGLPGDFIANAEAGLRALANLADGKLGLAGERWYLAGHAESEAARRAALAALADVPDAAAWAAEVDLLPPLDICRQKLARFSERNAILFRSGSAQITESSSAALDELAGYLAICPDSAIHVEGHTDSDGPDELNLALSVARAEAVATALVGRGIGIERLYAIGYGESLPVASNDTAEGKQANRRIVFSLHEDPR